MIKAVVWDVGEVLITSPKVESFWKSKEEAKKLRKEFGSGRLPTQEFIVRGSNLLNLDQSKFLEDYKKTYCSLKPMNEVLEIYKNMKTDKHILSDTNPIHLDFVKKNFPKIFEMSKKNYFSSDIGLRKDSEEVFNFVSNDLSLSPKEILLIDDKKAIVDLSKDSGWNAIQFVNTKQLKNELNKMGVA